MRKTFDRRVVSDPVFTTVQLETFRDALAERLRRDAIE